MVRVILTLQTKPHIVSAIEPLRPLSKDLKGIKILQVFSIVVNLGK